jgi:predicted negative regulator of RcsB-dependent stress response
MVNVHLSEEEQVEELKKWWKENGKSVVAGVVLGLGGVLGWQYWTGHQKGLAEQASMQFEQLNNSVAAGSVANATKQAEQLIADHGGSSYAVFAALDLAKVKLNQGDNAGARAQLQWVIDNASDASLAQVARLRMARIMLSEGDSEAALAVIGQAPADGFKGDIAELRGDIALKKGDLTAAREAYQEALAGEVSNRALVQMKYDDLAGSASL